MPIHIHDFFVDIFSLCSFDFSGLVSRKQCVCGCAQASTCVAIDSSCIGCFIDDPGCQVRNAVGELANTASLVLATERAAPLYRHYPLSSTASPSSPSSPSSTRVAALSTSLMWRSPLNDWSLSLPPPPLLLDGGGTCAEAMHKLEACLNLSTGDQFLSAVREEQRQKKRKKHTYTLFSDNEYYFVESSYRKLI